MLEFKVKVKETGRGKYKNRRNSKKGILRRQLGMKAEILPASKKEKAQGHGVRTGTLPSHWGAHLDRCRRRGCEAGSSEEGTGVRAWQGRLWAATRVLEK